MQDVAVSLRLADGATSTGRLEVRHQGRWRFESLQARGADVVKAAVAVGRIDEVELKILTSVTRVPNEAIRSCLVKLEKLLLTCTCSKGTPIVRIGRLVAIGCCL